jgi:type II secretory pathway component HofQ
MGGFIIEPSLRRCAPVSLAGVPVVRVTGADVAGVVFPAFVVAGAVFPAPPVDFVPLEAVVDAPLAAAPPTESGERGAPDRSPRLSPRAAASALVLSLFVSRVLHPNTHTLAAVSAYSAVRLAMYLSIIIVTFLPVSRCDRR